MPFVMRRRATSAITSRPAPGGSVMASPEGPEPTCTPRVLAASTVRALSSSEHSTWRTTEALESSSEMGPCLTTLPRSTMATASQVRSTSSSRCEERTTVRPSATSAESMDLMSCMPAGSRPFMGSSRMSSSGSPSRQAATPRRWRIPIEYLATLSDARWVMPTRSSEASMRSDRIDASLERVGMTQRASDKVAKYSMGMRQRLGVAACLLGDPELLILDEPMNGLDPAGMHDMRDMILSLVAEGRTVVLSSHLLDEVERTCDAVAIVDRGNVIRQGPIAELLAGTAQDLQIECST